MIRTMRTGWTKRRDEVLLQVLRLSENDYKAAAGAIKRLTRGVFRPSPKRCEARALTLQTVRDAISAHVVEKRQLASSARSRVRPPIATRLPPPTTIVLSVPVDCELYDEHFASKLLSALPPGWRWEAADPDETRRDAIASARHQALLRSAPFMVIFEEPGKYATVATIEHGFPAQRVAQLFVARIEPIEKSE